MIRFNIKNGKLIIDPMVLTVSVFNDIWEWDASKNKSKASNLLTYIFHMCDITQENPFRDAPLDQKEQLAKRNTFGKKDYKFSAKEKDLVEAGMAWYNVLNKTSVYRLAMALDNKIDEITTYFETNVIKNVNDFDNQSDSLQKIEKILNAKKRADEYARSETDKVRIRGQQVSSPLEEGLIGYTKSDATEKPRKDSEEN